MVKHTYPNDDAGTHRNHLSVAQAVPVSLLGSMGVDHAFIPRTSCA